MPQRNAIAGCDGRHAQSSLGGILAMRAPSGPRTGAARGGPMHVPTAATAARESAVPHFDALRAPHAARVLPDALLGELHALLGDRLTTSRAVREHHGIDISSYPVTPPDAVAFPESIDE